MFKFGVYRKCQGCGKFSLRRISKKEWKCTECKKVIKDSDIDKRAKLG